MTIQVGAVERSAGDPWVDGGPIDLLSRQTSILELIARGAPLADILLAVCATVEELLPGGRCSVLLLDAESATLRHGAAPSLPGDYCRLVDGIRIGPKVGSCGTAAFLRRPVVVADVRTDPLWEGFRDVAAAHQLRACWSTPIFGRGGRTVLGTFAVYHDEPFVPHDGHYLLIERFSHLAAVAIEHHRLFSEVRESEERFRRVFEDSAAGMALLVEDRFLEVNAALCRLLAREPGALQPCCISDVTHPDDAPMVLEACRRLLDGSGGGTQLEVRLARGEETTGRRSNAVADGRWVWALLSVSLLRGTGDHQHQFLIQVQDVTERRRILAALEHQALHDPLTDLPNRSLLMDRLRQAIVRSARSQKDVGLLFVDLDRFKLVNDGLGHGSGDELLIAVARRLSEALRPADTVARFGGDEFVVLCENLTDRDELLLLAKRVARVLGAAFPLERGEVFLSASIGIALGRAQDSDPEDMLAQADAAMYRAKERGRSRYEFFDEDLTVSARERLRLENELRRAVEGGELRLYYQPVVDLAERRVTGVEALLRWKRPGHGLVEPSEFIRTAEETGLVVPLGAWALEMACAQAADWQRRFGALAPRTWVNISGRQLMEPDLELLVGRVLSDAGIEPGLIGLEITESAVMSDAAAAQSVLAGLRRLGLALGVDDFGTGYSSLAYLKRFQVDVLKIDRSFVGGLGCDAEDRALVEAMIAMGRALGLHVVVEGIESEAALHEAASLGCTAAQGFLLGRPMPAPAIEALLAPARQGG